MNKLQLQEIIAGAEFYDKEQTKSDIKNNLESSVIEFINEFGFVEFRQELNRILVNAEGVKANFNPAERYKKTL